jgi:hypothetical protein
MVNGDDANAQEVARLRAEVSRLEAALHDRPPEPTVPLPVRHQRNGVWRPIVAGVLIVIAALLAPLSVVAIWAHDEIGDTDRYVETVAPLAKDPAVQDAISTRITDEIFSRLDVKAITQDAVDALAERGLPPAAATSLKALATPLSSGVRSFVSDKVDALVASPQFQQAWEAANRQAHAQLVAVLTGDLENSAVSVEGKTVSVNLATVIESVKGKLEAEGFALASKIPAVNAQFTIVQSVDITKAQNYFRLLKGASQGLPVLAILLLAVAVAIGRSRRRTLLVAALSMAASMLLLGLTLNLFRGVYLNGVPPDVLPTDAAAAIYDQLVHFIRLNLRAALVVFLAIAAITWVTGPESGPVALRRGSTRAIDVVRNRTDEAGIGTGAFGSALYQYRTALQGVILGGALLVYVLADHPTGKFAIIVLLVALFLLLVLELLSRPPRTAPAATTSPAE